MSMMRSVEFVFKCPVCGERAVSIGDGLPVFMRDIGMCGGMAGILLVNCRNMECGVLFTRERPAKEALNEKHDG